MSPIEGEIKKVNPKDIPSASKSKWSEPGLQVLNHILNNQAAEVPVSGGADEVSRVISGIVSWINRKNTGLHIRTHREPIANDEKGNYLVYFSKRGEGPKK